MIEINNRAVEKLNKELRERCFLAGIGFRITLTKYDNDKLGASLKFDRQRDGDITQDLDGLKIFYSPEAQKLGENYRLDFFNDPEGRFYLIKKTTDIKEAQHG